jgi:hypothetical protein
LPEKRILQKGGEILKKVTKRAKKDNAPQNPYEVFVPMAIIKI